MSPAIHTSRILRPFLILLLALAALVPASRLHAQDPPWAAFEPAAGSVFQTQSAPVTVRFSHATSLNMTTAVVKLNDTIDVTGFFTFTPPAQGTGVGSSFIQSTGTATLSLQPGENTLTAMVCDQSMQLPCAGDVYTTTYYYAAGQQGVRVLPDGDTKQVSAGGTHADTFYVKNTWSLEQTFTLRATCRDAWTETAVSGCSAPGSVTVAAGDSAAVSVSFPGGSAGREMVVRLLARSGASVQDAGWVDVTTGGTWGGGPAAPGVALVDLNSGSLIERGECVTVAIAPGAAYECGDLRMAHGLPAHRTLGRTWAPVLLYNSQHAHPMPTVYADVTIPSGPSSPSTVQVVVSLAGGAVHQATYPGSDFTPGVPRRVGVQWDALTGATGVYAYTLQVTSHYAGSSLSSTVSGRLAVVNRHYSTLGAGWWVGGRESLVCVDCSAAQQEMLWVGGDGSTRIYERVSPGVAVWTAANPSGPRDTVYATTVPGSADIYVRKIPGGGRVEFDMGGQHLRTVNRLGQATEFVLGTGGRLEAIRAPVPAGQGAREWVLSYDGAYVTQVAATAPGTPNRTVTLQRQGGGFPVSSVCDADSKCMTLEYGTGAYSPRVQALVDRGGTRHAFAYDGAAKLSSARLWMDPATVQAQSADDLVRQFQASESRGVARTGTTGASVAASQAYTRIDGPRTDVADHTDLWLTSRGAPRRIRNPEGAETLLTRGDTRFPSLVTAVRSSNATGDSLLLQSSATYDTLALVTRSVSHNPRGDLRNDTTVMVWDTKWRRPQNVFQRSTGQQIGTTTITYDSATGNMTSQLVGTASRRVNYTYWTTGAGVGQLASIRYPHPTTGVAGGGGIDSVYYDAMGNVRSTRSPLGFRSVVVRDALGRDSISYSPIDSTLALTEANVIAHGAWSRVEYDAMERPVLAVSHGPARTHALGPEGWAPQASAAEEVMVTTTYDDMGRTLGVLRETSPWLGEQYTEYAYDRAGRKTQERNGTTVNEYAYDKAGNVVVWNTPRNHDIITQYDVMGRPVRKSVPAVSTASECVTVLVTSGCYSFPHRPNNGTGYLIPSDTTWMAYDLLGRMVYARNNDAIVTRSYLPNGAIRSDTTRMRQYGGHQFTSHVYGIEYGHDRMGRLSRLRHPTNLATVGTAQVDTFAYDATTGYLSYARDRSGNEFSFHEDLMGRPTSMHMPGASAALIDSTVYDIGSRVVRRMTGSASTPAGMMDERMQYDARGKTIRVDLPNGTASVSVNWYSGLGNLVGTEWDNVGGNGNSREAYVVDALGNIRQKRTPLASGGNPPYDPHYRYTLDPVNGRVTGISYTDVILPPMEPFANDESTREYDASGNMTVGRQAREGSEYLRQSVTRNWYGADETLRATQTSDGEGPSLRGVWEEYRYDPLGRRILVRSVRSGLCSAAGELCLNTVTRYVWSGDQILWEMRVPGADGDNLEATTATGVPSGEQIRWGRVSYFHAGGIDRPLSIRKDEGTSIIPHTNWRGLFAWGTWGAGSLQGVTSDCQSGVPPTNCVNLAWPGWQTSAWHVDGNAGETEYWMGSLVDGMRDASGQIYMRNRYYDPATGQFTQQDPIGLAGGLNAYGFAAGDPVSYSDPYGLCPEHMRDANGACPGGLAVREWNAVVATLPNMSLEARTETANSLLAGRVHGDNLPGDIAGEVRPEAPGHMYINRSAEGGSIFSNRHELGKTLVHEGRHIKQLEGKAAGREAAEFIARNKDRLEADAYRYENQNYNPRGWDTAVPDASNWGNRRP